jgi:hypothetical protein
MSTRHLLSIVMALLMLSIPPPQLSAQEKANEQRCEVHGEVLKRDRVPIFYGLVMQPLDYEKDRQKSFPNANTSVYGGCVVEFDSNNQQTSPQHADVLYCQRCREAAARWWEEYSAKRPRNVIELLSKPRKHDKKAKPRSRG